MTSIDEQAALKLIGLDAGQFDAYMRGMKVGDGVTGGYMVARTYHDMMRLWCGRNRRPWRFQVTFPSLPRIERIA